MYRIKEGYVENPGPKYFVDEAQGTLIYQPDVLPTAAVLAIEAAGGKHPPFIIDVGCGRAEKLAAIHAEHPDWRFYGIDFGENLRWCEQNYDWGEWYEADLEQEYEIRARGGVVVASDVLEHLVDPRPLLHTLRKSGAYATIISTPERDLQNGVDHMGPCPNPYHVREWNRAELAAFLEDEGFVVKKMGLTRSNDGGPEEHTILAVVK